MLYGEIASGGMASVHFGRLLGPAGFARPVAIKRLHPQFAKDPDFVRMFLDEARLAARIAHPNVVQTLDVVGLDDEIFVVMDYVAGVTLSRLARAARNRGDRIPLLVGLGIVSGMLHGLHAAHEARSDLGEPLDLVHRDVSPQNALVGTDGVTRLLDFGIAKAAGRLQSTREGQLKGKLAYMAPEQAMGEAITRRTDVYAASVVLWELLTGKRLFYAHNEAHVLAKVLSGDVPRPSSVVAELPHALDRIVLRGLERDPAARYATAREMAIEIDARIGVASPTEIADWVERTAADELRERALLIASIERRAAAPVDPAGGNGASGVEARDGFPPSGRGTPYSWGQATRVEGRPPLDRVDSNVTSGLAVLPGRRRRLALAIVGPAAGMIALAFAYGYGRAGGSRAAIEAKTAAVQTLALPAPGAGTAGTPSAPTVKIDAVPMMKFEDLPMPDAGPPVGGPTAGEAQVRPRGAATAPGTAGTAPAPRPTASADCNPPYTADERGHIHFKPECL